MGDTIEVAVDVEAMLDEAPRLADTIIEWLTVEGIVDATPAGDHARIPPALRASVAVSLPRCDNNRPNRIPTCGNCVTGLA